MIRTLLILLMVGASSAYLMHAGLDAIEAREQAIAAAYADAGITWSTER